MTSFLDSFSQQETESPTYIVGIIVSYQRNHRPSTPGRIRTNPADGYQTNSSTFGTLLSSQGSSAHRSRVVRPARGQPGETYRSWLAESNRLLGPVPLRRSSPGSWSEAASARTRSASSEGTCKGGGLPGPAGQPLGFPSRRTGRQREHYGSVSFSSNRVGVPRATFRVVAGQRRFFSFRHAQREPPAGSGSGPEYGTNNSTVVHDLPAIRPRAAVGRADPLSRSASVSSSARSSSRRRTPDPPSTASA